MKLKKIKYLLKYALMKNGASRIRNIFSFIFGKKIEEEQNVESARKSLENLFASIDKFSQKADGLLKEKWPELAARIKKLQAKVHSMKPDVSTLAGKFEQDIAQKITIASSACEVLLAGGDETNFAFQLSELERIVNQRLRPAVSAS